MMGVSHLGHLDDSRQNSCTIKKKPNLPPGVSVISHYKQSRNMPYPLTQKGDVHLLKIDKIQRQYILKSCILNVSTFEIQKTSNRSNKYV